MLYLDTRIHFDEVELIAFQKEFNGSGIYIANVFHQLKSSVTDFVTNFIRHGNARCHFDYFLMTTLHRAVTLVEVNNVTVLIP